MYQTLYQISPLTTDDSNRGDHKYRNIYKCGHLRISMYIEKRKSGKNIKYYLIHSYREKDRVEKIRKYLGSNLSKDELEKAKKRAEEKIKKVGGKVTSANESSSGAAKEPENTDNTDNTQNASAEA